MRFVPFTENNEHEGETWTFWLQLEGNVEELAWLKECVSKGQDDNYDYPYDLDLNTAEDEMIVDKLVEHGHMGYMNSHHKVKGLCTFPESLIVDDGPLYKGGVEDFFKV